MISPRPKLCHSRRAFSAWARSISSARHCGGEIGFAAAQLDFEVVAEDAEQGFARLEYCPPGKTGRDGFDYTPDTSGEMLT